MFVYKGLNNRFLGKKMYFKEILSGFGVEKVWISDCLQKKEADSRYGLDYQPVRNNVRR